MTKDEVSNVTVSPNQSLLLRCREQELKALYSVWEKGGKILDAQTLACSSKDEKEVQ